MNDLRKDFIEYHNKLSSYLNSLEQHKIVKELKLAITEEFIKFTEKKNITITDLYKNILIAINDFYKIED